MYLVWILPAYMCFIFIQQVLVYKGTIETFENGTTYMAEVTDFDIKQIAAQSNGYVDIRFEKEDSVIERRLSLSVQMAQNYIEESIIPIRYHKKSFQDIVLTNTYDIQKSTTLINMGVAFIAFGATFIIALFVQRYVNRKLVFDDSKFDIERVD